MSVRTSLTILSIAALLWILDKGKPFLVPVAASALLAFSLMPVIRLGQRARLAPSVVASIILLAVGFGGAAIVSSNADDAVKLVGRMPELTRFIVGKVRRLVEMPGTEFQISRGSATPATRAIDGMSASSASTVDDRNASGLAELLSLDDAGEPGTGIDQIADPVNLRELAANAASGLVSGAGQAFVIALLTFFLLISADSMKTKLFNLAGDRLSQKKIALRALEESGRQIQLYLLITLVANLIIAFFTWLLLLAVGVESAASWAIALGIAHTIPYVGAIAGTLLISMAAVFQFESWQIGLQVFLGLGIICAVVGTVIMTLMQGKAAKMDPAVLFIGILLFTFLWGPWGLLLGAPILAVAKTIMHYAGAERLTEVMGA